MAIKKTVLYILGGWLALGTAAQLSDCTRSTGSSMKRAAKEAEQKVEDIRGEISSLHGTITESKADSLLREMERIHFNYDASNYEDEDAQRVEDVNRSIKATSEELRSRLESCHVSVMNIDSKLFETDTVFPVYLEKGECLYVYVEAENSATVSVYNADRESVEKSYKKTRQVNDSIPIRFSAIYLVDVNPSGKQYCNVDITYRPNSIERLRRPTHLTVTSENCRKGDFMAKEINGIKMEKAFEEPRKLTLRGHLKAAFSGSAVALVPIQVPKGASDILYNLRISTNETPPRREKDFYEGMDLSYKKIKIMGLPLYESSGGSGLLSTLLGLNQPVREEDAYINMYVFYDAAQARKFQNGTPANQLKYNLDYSTLGTQSCNGRIPCKGYNTVYLAFENERMRYNNYVWLSALLSVPHTEYVRAKYSK